MRQALPTIGTKRIRRDRHTSRNRFKSYPRLQLDASWSNFLAAFKASFESHNRAELEICKLIQQKGGNENCVAGLSVRTLFDALLQVLKLPYGSEVLISAATIKNIGDIINAHGLVAIPIDLNFDSLAPDLEMAAEFVSERTKLLIVTPLFGAQIDLQSYAAFCNEHKLLLIEDMAQGYDGRYVGNPNADFCLLSFGPIKTATAFAGGLLHTQHPYHAEGIQRVLGLYDPLPNSWYRKRVMKLSFLKALSNPYAYWILIKLLHVAN